MNNENERIDVEIEEKETVEGEVVDEEITTDDINNGFDPNVILNTIMQSQDIVLRNVIAKLSVSSAISKVAVVCLIMGFLLANFFNYIGVVALVYGLYCTIYVLINYKKIKEKEYTIKDMFSKDGAPVDLKKKVLGNLLTLLVCIPFAVFSFWYRLVYMAS